MNNAGKMKVTIMFRNNWFGGDGWTYYPVDVLISDRCPTCGGKRGQPVNINQCIDGEWFGLDQWENECGHIDYYKDVYLEHKKAGSTINSPTLN